MNALGFVEIANSRTKKTCTNWYVLVQGEFVETVDGRLTCIQCL